MNSDNPYAAPQTIELRTPSALPMAEMSGRNLFPELDTLQLGRLADYSHTMQLMTRLWVIPLVICSFLIFSIYSVHAGVPGYILLVVPFIALRIVGGQVRGTLWRYYTAFLDGLICLGFLLGIVGGLVRIPDWGSLLFFLPLCCALGFLAIIGFTSFLAHRCAPELFGPQSYLHRELMQEIDYRKQHGIG